MVICFGQRQDHLVPSVAVLTFLSFRQTFVKKEADYIRSFVDVLC
jgi:hypothetical protein